ncbi:hypothetical protein M5X00_31650 [Paenibacillus alvei]|nr:hypothetical protein [Paenibacillus alvei]MCY9708147.1 hypothetical protein [Paenibacillus alvei]MCY9758775.1 hypothetical protein [Paenibacillus alvei]
MENDENIIEGGGRMRALLFIAISLVGFHVLLWMTNVRRAEEFTYVLVLVGIGLLMDVSYKLSILIKKKDK